MVNIVCHAVGNRGLFGQRKRSAHCGSLSYVGPRSKNSHAMSTPSEGLTYSKHCYYQNHASHTFWPFVLSLINMLSQSISLITYYQFAFFAKLLPLPIQSPSRKEFCDIAILTVDYSNTLHVDSNDNIPYLDNKIASDLKIIVGNEHLNCKLKMEAELALKHLSQYGMSCPTTCGYQLVKGENISKVDVIQFFCCRSLGL